VHSILASRLGKDDQAYEFYLRTARLDLDDYNAEVEEGLHITSMAGTWMSIVEGFAGMRVENNLLSFRPNVPKAWSEIEFRINFRNIILSVTLSKDSVLFSTNSDATLKLLVHDVEHEIKGSTKINL
jgi:maltose phosphorylase